MLSDWIWDSELDSKSKKDRSSGPSRHTAKHRTAGNFVPGDPRLTTPDTGLAGRFLENFKNFVSRNVGDSSGLRPLLTWDLQKIVCSPPPQQGSSRLFPDEASLVKHSDTIHDHFGETLGVVVRIGVGSAIRHRCGIKHHEVGSRAGGDSSPIPPSEGVGRERGHAADCLFQCQHTLLPDITRQRSGSRRNGHPDRIETGVKCVDYGLLTS